MNFNSNIGSQDLKWLFNKELQYYVRFIKVRIVSYKEQKCEKAEENK